MSSRTRLSGLCVLISAGCLAAGCALAAQWIMLPAALIALAAGIGALKWPHAGLSPVALLVSVGLAGAGLLMGASPTLMIVSATFALAGWDLANFGRKLPATTSAGVDPRLERGHLQSLMLAVGLGLLAALMGRMLIFRIPFGAMLVLVIAILFSLDRVWRALTQ